MASQRLAVVGVLAVLFLGGCTDDPAHPADGTTPAALPAEFDETTGGLEGVVITQDFLPIPGAGIQIRALDISAVADASGAFSISHLLPGKHLVSAGKAGYLSKSLEVSITEGQVEQVEFQLFANASEARPKFKDMQLKSGTFGCGASVAALVGVVFAGPSGTNACGITGVVTEVTGQNLSSTNNAFLTFTINKEQTVFIEGMVFEMQWTSTQALGKGLTMDWELDGCVNADPKDEDDEFGEGTIVYQAGVSPLRVELNRTTWEKLADVKDTICTSEEGLLEDTKKCGELSCTIILRVWPAAETTGDPATADVGAAFLQPFESALTAFYNQTVPKDFSALK